MSDTQPTAPAAKLAYSIAEVVALTPFSERTIYREIAAGSLKARKRGSSTFILAVDLEAFLTGAALVQPEPVQ